MDGSYEREEKVCGRIRDRPVHDGVRPRCRRSARIGTDTKAACPRCGVQNAARRHVRRSSAAVPVARYTATQARPRRADGSGSARGAGAKRGSTAARPRPATAQGKRPPVSARHHGSRRRSSTAFCWPPGPGLPRRGGERRPIAPRRRRSPVARRRAMRSPPTRKPFPPAHRHLPPPLPRRWTATAGAPWRPPVRLRRPTPAGTGRPRTGCVETGPSRERPQGYAAHPPRATAHTAARLAPKHCGRLPGRRRSPRKNPAEGPGGERETRLELATSTLARLRSTN